MVAGPRFGRYDAFARTATVYYTMSTWKPYQVMLMESVLRLECRYTDAVCPR